MTVVTACGMSTPIGRNAAASCAAFRARLDNFQETRFQSPEGEWILGAEVPLDGNPRGLSRLSRLLVSALQECFSATDMRPEEVPVLICLAEPERPGRIAGLEAGLIESVTAMLGHALHPASKTLAYGHVGGGVAVRDARALLGQGAGAVVVAGVDSLLTARGLARFFADGRALSPRNSNGFLPGEAGAAVLLSNTGEGVPISGLGLSSEPAHIHSGEPLRGDGMVAAMSEALDQAGLRYEDLSLRIADLSGEHYYFREATLAQIRLWRGAGNPEDVWLPCDGMGHTGAAVVPICLGVGLVSWQKGYAPGPNVMIHAADDDGRRMALVLKGRPHGQ